MTFDFSDRTLKYIGSMISSLSDYISSHDSKYRELTGLSGVENSKTIID